MDVKVSDRCKLFLQQPQIQECLKNLQFETIYTQYCRYDSNMRVEITEFFLSCGVNPFLYMENVPGGILVKSTVTNIPLTNKNTKIETCAFFATPITSIIIPDSVTEMGAGVFMNCTNLTDVTLSKNLTQISEELFSGCSKLDNVTIPRGVTCIYDCAFENCISLQNIRLPITVVQISNLAFSGCANLEVLKIPRGVRQLGDYVVDNCPKLKEIYCPEYLNDILGTQPTNDAKIINW